MSTEKFLFEIAADTKGLRAELDKAHTGAIRLGKGVKKTEDKFKRFSKSAATGITALAAAVTAATTAFTAYATAQGRAIRETESLAILAGVTTEEFRKMSFVMGTVGISGEKFGDIMKDTQERIGDFLATGGGPFQDFADVMDYTKEEATELAKEFETMSGQEVLQAMVDRMEDAGQSTQRMSFALEGMASDTTRLIPLLKDGGAAAESLGNQFDKINVPLSEEEKQQFKDLANNVDLAQDSFINFLNNAVSPFLPAINAAANALTEFFASAALGMDLERIVDDGALLGEVNTLTEINKLEARTIELIEEKEKKLENGRVRGETVYKARLNELNETRKLIEARKAVIIAENKEKEKGLDLDSKKGNLTGTRSSIDSEEDNQAALDAIQERFKSETQLLQEKYLEEKLILDKVVEDEAQRNELKYQLATEFVENYQAIQAEAREVELQETEKALAEKAELEFKAGKAKTKLEESVAQNGIALLKTIAGENKAAALIALGIQKASALSANATATISGSMLAYASQLIPGDPTSIARAEAAKNYTMGLGKVNAGLIVATGLSEAASITSGGGGGGNFSGSGGDTPTEQPIQSFNEQGSTVTDISDGESTTVPMQLIIDGEALEVMAVKVDNMKRNGQV